MGEKTCSDGEMLDHFVKLNHVGSLEGNFVGAVYNLK